MAAPIDYKAYYKLADDANDETGNYNGVNNGVTFDGISGDFNGNSDYIELLSNGKGSSFETQALTITCWAYFEDKGEGATDNTVFSYDFTSQAVPYYATHLRQMEASQALFFGTNYGGTFKGSASSPSTPYGEWRFIALTLESGSQKVYDNKAEVAALTETGTISFYDQEVWIGKANYDAFMSGKLKNLRFYDYVLTPAEMSDIYDEEIDDFPHETSFEIFSDVSEDVARVWDHFIDNSRDLTPTYQTFSDVSADDILISAIFQDVSIDHHGFLQIFADVSANNENIKWSRFYDISSDETIIHEDTLIKRSSV